MTRYEEIINEIEIEIQQHNDDIGREIASKGVNSFEDIEKSRDEIQKIYFARRKVTAKNIYNILFTAFNTANQRTSDAEAVLRRCISLAGNPDAADGCRNIINEITQFLEK